MTTTARTKARTNAEERFGQIATAAGKGIVDAPQDGASYMQRLS